MMSVMVVEKGPMPNSPKPTCDIFIKVYLPFFKIKIFTWHLYNWGNYSDSLLMVVFQSFQITIYPTFENERESVEISFSTSTIYVQTEFHSSKGV